MQGQLCQTPCNRLRQGSYKQVSKDKGESIRKWAERVRLRDRDSKKKAGGGGKMSSDTKNKMKD